MPSLRNRAGYAADCWVRPWTAFTRSRKAGVAETPFPSIPSVGGTIDAKLTASELVRHAESGTPLTDNQTVARFVKWVAKKPADFHSATK